MDDKLLEKLNHVSVVLVEGEEALVASRWLEEILDNYLPSSVRILNYAKLEASEISPSDLISRLEEFPMMAERRVIVVRYISIWDAAKQRRLAKYLASSNMRNLLILWMISSNKGGGGSKKSAKGEIDKELAAQISKAGYIFKATLTPAEKTNNTLPIFQLLDAVGTRNNSLCCKVLKTLWEEKTDPHYVLSTVAGHLRLLLLVYQYLTYGMDSKAIASQLKLHPYRVSKAISQTKQYTSVELMKALEYLLATDLAIKTGQLEPREGVELATLKVSLKLKEKKSFKPDFFEVLTGR